MRKVRAVPRAKIPSAYSTPIATPEGSPVPSPVPSPKPSPTSSQTASESESDEDYESAEEGVVLTKAQLDQMTPAQKNNKLAELIAQPVDELDSVNQRKKRLKNVI